MRRSEDDIEDARIADYLRRTIELTELGLALRRGKNKGVGSSYFMTEGAAPLSFIPMCKCCNRFLKFPRVEPARTLTATFCSLQAPIAIRLRRSWSIRLPHHPKGPFRNALERRALPPLLQVSFPVRGRVMNVEPISAS